MASSRVMASTTSSNSDLTRQSSLFSHALAELQSSVSDDQAKNLGSMNMDDILRNIYGENPAAEFPPASGGVEVGRTGGEDIASGSRGEGGMLLPRQGGFLLSKGAGSKTVDDVWKDMAVGDRMVVDGDASAYKTVGHVGMTLEDYLAREVGEENIRGASGEVPQQVDSSILQYGMDSVMDDRFSQQQQQQQQQQQHIEGSFMGLVNGIEGARTGGGRGKRRALEEPVDKVAQQRQKRMIKNRESAARSRERKHAYTVELESVVTTLEEENASLVRQQEVWNVERRKQEIDDAASDRSESRSGHILLGRSLQWLMENVIPVVERKRPPGPPPRRLRRNRSMHW